MAQTQAAAAAAAMVVDSEEPVARAIITPPPVCAKPARSLRIPAAEACVASPQDVVGDASPELSRTKKLVIAGLHSQGRGYGGASLAFMMNQEAMTTLKALKPTGSRIPAAGKAKVVKQHITHPVRLYHVKGKKHIRVHVAPLSVNSLNRQVFVGQIDFYSAFPSPAFSRLMRE